ncbi:MAG: hypothetical protein PHN91_03355 [Patescibacteria group bacterium]|jgi:hypothetical protein|nr:hypothetical protein [Patescibacteria group bacterium]
MTKLVPIVSIALVTLAIVIGLTYGFGALGAADSATNMTGSPYEEEYNATVSGSATSLSLMGSLPIVLVIIGFIAVFTILRRP